MLTILGSRRVSLAWRGKRAFTRRPLAYTRYAPFNDHAEGAELHSKIAGCNARVCKSWWIGQCFYQIGFTRYFIRYAREQRSCAVRWDAKLSSVRLKIGGTVVLRLGRAWAWPNRGALPLSLHTSIQPSQPKVARSTKIPFRTTQWRPGRFTRIAATQAQ